MPRGAEKRKWRQLLGAIWVRTGQPLQVRGFKGSEGPVLLNLWEGACRVGVTADKGESKEDRRPEGGGAMHTGRYSGEWSTREGATSSSLPAALQALSGTNFSLGREGAVWRRGFGEGRGSVK